MDAETATLQQLIEEYTVVMNESAKFVFFVRDTELQLQEINELTTLKKRIKKFKYGAIQAGDENSANNLFHLQCMFNSMISFLRMWINLKKSDYYEAWVNLIDAEEYVSIALRAADSGDGLEEFLDRLKRVEDIVFPGYNVYNSWGAIIRGGKCTICGKLLNNCQHIEGIVYWGRLCVRVHPEIVKLDHVALVEEPLDRRCVITEITTEDGYYRDYMTWRKTKKAEEKKEGTLGSFIGRAFFNQMLEVD